MPLLFFYLFMGCLFGTLLGGWARLGSSASIAYGREQRCVNESGFYQIKTRPYAVLCWMKRRDYDYNCSCAGSNPKSVVLYNAFICVYSSRLKPHTVFSNLVKPLNIIRQPTRNAIKPVASVLISNSCHFSIRCPNAF
jgi:hypothetical protein